MNRSTGTRPVGLRRAIRFVSDGTGRSHEEVVMLATVAAVATTTVAVWRTVTWAVDTLTDLDTRPDSPRRAGG